MIWWYRVKFHKNFRDCQTHRCYVSSLTNSIHFHWDQHGDTTRIERNNDFRPSSSICFLFPLLLALVLVELQNTCKKSWTEKCSKDPTYAIFLKSWGFKDVKYDIPMCQSHSTRPQPIQLVPTMQKKLFMSSFQAKFLKIRFTKVAVREHLP